MRIESISFDENGDLIFFFFREKLDCSEWWVSAERKALILQFKTHPPDSYLFFHWQCLYMPAACRMCSIRGRVGGRGQGWREVLVRGEGRAMWGDLNPFKYNQYPEPSTLRAHRYGWFLSFIWITRKLHIPRHIHICIYIYFNCICRNI